MSDMMQAAAIILAALLIYRFRAPILARLQRFDARNIARRREEMRDRADANAHFKHTLRLAEEQVEAVQETAVRDERTAQPVNRYLFEGETYLTREDAEAARAERIRDIARGFYMDLPRALAERRKGKLH
ncbi:MAG: hypothetical protein ACREHE_03950 [Rhizomicrobium sp.]